MAAFAQGRGTFLRFERLGSGYRVALWQIISRRHKKSAQPIDKDGGENSETFYRFLTCQEFEHKLF